MANNAVRLTAPALLGALILLFPADGLRALGLGEARVDSWLGQPLDVSIRLLEVESQAIESVSVGPASLEDFERLGVPSQSLGLGLEVTVDRSAQPPIVRVRSQRPVNDPVVQILIDARWSSGRVLREYTLFLDPPVTESAAPVREVSEPASEPSRQPEPAVSEPEPSRPADRTERPERPTSVPEQQATQQPAASPTQGADSVTVSQGDTLWSIAQDWRPDRSLSMDQVMLAIFNRNRDAFLGKNINRLRSDIRLEMPGLDDVRAVDRAEAQRRVREHMRSWQPGVAEEVPVVSDAAMPESGTQSDQGSTEPESAESEPQTADAAQGDEDFRLDVVPPEEDQYSESSVVAEGEIEAVSDQLADVEREIAAEGLESEAFDDHVNEIRDALEQRDMAGLAVAEESLAELETRLREAREARAEQERLAQDANGDQATDSEEGDQIADYMSELEDEFGTQDGEQADSGDEAMATAEDGAAEGMDGADGAASDEPAGADEASGESEQTAAAEEQTAEVATDAESGQPDDGDMAVTRTSSGGVGWLWPVVGVLILVAVVAGGLIWMRRRRQAEDAGDWSAGSGDAADSARASIARDPGDLVAHLSLLKLLADQGREQEFTDAFDQMYQHVDDETAPEWQEALSLAAAHVPDHPLLTPRETAVDEDFDRREDEMLGMLDVEEPDAGESDEQQADEDDTFDLGLEDEAESTAFAAEDRGKEDDKEETFDEDTDLAVLSERLDDPSSDSRFEHHREDEEDDADFREFKEIDEYGVDDDAESESESEPDEHSEAPVELEDEKAPEPDLDFDASREQEADEIFGEAGARDEEDLDLELNSDVEGVDSGHADAGLDFDLGETAEPEPSQAAAEDEGGEPADKPESLELEQPGDAGESEEGESAPVGSGGSLSDEDADVKLDLARAYISVDLADSARTVLEEVISDGSNDKRAEAEKLLEGIE